MEVTFHRTLPRLEMGFATLLIAHLSFDIPYVILNVLPKLRQMDKSLIDAAQDLGCTWMGAFWKVVVPEIKPGIVSGALIAFTMSIDDFVISYFTAGSTSTLSIEIYSMVRRRVSPELNAVSTLLFVTVLVCSLSSMCGRPVGEKKRPSSAQQKSSAGAAHSLFSRPAGPGDNSKLCKNWRNDQLKKIVALTLATAVAAGLFLSGCEMSETEFTDGSGSTGSSNGSSGQREVNVCSWGEYNRREPV